jgi:dTDP-4-amino-4,6-dideoxygalactose transaminase
MRLHGMNRDAFDRFTAKVPSWYYEVVAPGFKYNLTDIAAALGLHQLAKAAALPAAARRDRPAVRRRPGRPAGDPAAPAAAGRRAPLAPLRAAPGPEARLGRDRPHRALFARGIGCSVHYIPLHLHPYWRDRYALRPRTSRTARRPTRRHGLACRSTRA